VSTCWEGRCSGCCFDYKHGDKSIELANVGSDRDVNEFGTDVVSLSKHMDETTPTCLTLCECPHLRYRTFYLRVIVHR
jgi:hypothetical protein